MQVFFHLIQSIAPGPLFQNLKISGSKPDCLIMDLVVPVASRMSMIRFDDGSLDTDVRFAQQGFFYGLIGF